MCGIVGMHLRKRLNTSRTIAETKKLADIFTSMLCFAEERGHSATGVVVSYRDWDKKRDRVSVLRAPVSASELVTSKEYQTLMSQINQDTYFVIGHTRAATSGGAGDNRNNHPHKVGQIISVHNGHIYNERGIWHHCKEYGLSRQSECDSESISAVIEAHRLSSPNISLMESASNAIKMLDGWFSILFMNVGEPDSLYFTKDMTTPLDMRWLPEGRTALLASRDWYIKRALEKAGYTEKASRRIEVSGSVLYKLRSRLGGEDPAGIILETSEISLKKRMRVLSEEDERLLAITNGGSD